MTNSVDLLVASAAGNHAVLTARSSAQAVFRVAPPSPSGAPTKTFSIAVYANKSGVSAREEIPVNLPAFCPERHINIDGSFCLYFSEIESHPIIDLQDAHVWWGKLLLFLQRQRTAAVLKRWPGKSDARAHGNAAWFQEVAERSAILLGPRFDARFRQGRYTTKSINRGLERRVRMMLDGIFTAAIVEQPLRLLTKRSRCKCDAGRLPVCACADHAEVLARFIYALERWKVEEELFITEIKELGRNCCGTILNCPLAA